MKRLKFYLKYKLRKSESVKAVLYFIVIMSAIFGVQYINELFLPWSMSAIYIIIAFSVYKIAGGGREMFFPAIVITSFIFVLLVVPFTVHTATHGLESYIEHKYSLEPYKVIKCDYSTRTGLRECAVPGYPEAEKEANLIIGLIKFLCFAPIIIAIVVMAVRELKEKRERNLNNQSN